MPLDLVGLAAILGTFSIPLYAIKRRYDSKKQEQEAKKPLALEDAEAKQLREDNRLLRERVENLESIVSSVDYELNVKVAKLVDEQRASAPPPKESAALDRTATAIPTNKKVGLPTTELESGQVLAQRYRINRLLGRGGMGAVYLADDEVLGELVALKVISSAFAADEQAMVARFRREAAAARKVSSPTVIRIHDLGEARPGLLYRPASANAFIAAAF